MFHWLQCVSLTGRHSQPHCWQHQPPCVKFQKTGTRLGGYYHQWWWMSDLSWRSLAIHEHPHRTNTWYHPQELENDKTLHKRTKLSVDDLMTLTKFVLTTTYFTCMDNIYQQQQQGTAMGSPLSPIAVDLFMEWLEEKAIATAPLSCRLRLWKRYVDDVLEIIKKGEAENLTAHLNQIGSTGSIKFTYEEESDGSIAFLDTLIIRKEDGNMALQNSVSTGNQLTPISTSSSIHTTRSIKKN